MYEDITERIILERQREDFVATLTHDLKNPLLGTNRVLDLMVAGRMGPMEDNQQAILKQVRDSNASLIGMIQNLLDVYRYDSIKRMPECEQIEVSTVLDQAVRQTQIDGEAKHISVNLKLPEQEILAEISAHALGRVLQNLLGNAMKFTPENGSIVVELRNAGTHFHIEVSDSGPGIDEEEQKQLFKRFWQGNPGKKYSHGSGLGLYLCKQIIEVHGGTIACASIPGSGCSFTVTLPIAAKEGSQVVR